jgi:hypothetical protein
VAVGPRPLDRPLVALGLVAGHVRHLSGADECVKQVGPLPHHENIHRAALRVSEQDDPVLAQAPAQLLDELDAMGGRQVKRPLLAGGRAVASDRV